MYIIRPQDHQMIESCSNLQLCNYSVKLFPVCGNQAALTSVGKARKLQILALDTFNFHSLKVSAK